MDLETAQAHLTAWQEADLALAEAQSYEIELPTGRRRVTRADAATIKERIAYWQGEINKLKGKRQKRLHYINLEERD
jgi:hypothetical protein